MPRKGPAPKRPLVNDPVYGSQLVTQLVNKVLLDGKKSLAERIVYGALEQVEKKSGKDPLEIFTVALNNIKPMVEVKSRRVGGANYQVPVEVRPVRRVALAMRNGPAYVEMMFACWHFFKMSISLSKACCFTLTRRIFFMATSWFVSVFTPRYTSPKPPLPNNLSVI